ncbi:DNL zinc finger-domain-containing protein [Exophiala viscosa]|uniref:DNL zinc finger-domain-containing protein n=1 Tax=Exophiala viscosa TaxID=2486360 RepID=A0AAN6DP10_9EURO|nr:DNL zinc finger-domain-containing protein [Exophiala viscosa]
MQQFTRLTQRLSSSRTPVVKAIQPHIRQRSTLAATSFVPRWALPRRYLATSVRHQNSSLSVPGTPLKAALSRDEPSYQLSFTCKPCLHRSSHRVTKHGYHHGTVLVTCPSCKARHVIADHLKVFLDEKKTLEDILKDKLANGEDFTKLLKKGRLGIRPGAIVANEGEEDLEFWEDGTETTHTPLNHEKTTQQQTPQT